MNEAASIPRFPFPLVALRVRQPLASPTVWPMQNRVGTMLLLNLLKNALSAQGQLADYDRSHCAGPLNDSYYIFLVNLVAPAIPIIKKELEAVALLPTSTIFLLDCEQKSFCPHGPDGASVFGKFDIGAMRREAIKGVEIIRAAAAQFDSETAVLAPPPIFES